MPTIAQPEAVADRQRVADREAPVRRQPALHQRLARRPQVAALDDRVAAAAAEREVERRLPRLLAARPDERVAPLPAGTSARPRWAARARARRRVARDSSSKRAMTWGRSACSAARSKPVASPYPTVAAVPATSDAAAMPERREQPPAPHAGTSRPASSRSTRSAIPAAAGSCVTSTIARPSSASDAQQPQDGRARRLVEVPRRLVGQQQRRVVDERPRDREALLLAAGELVGERARHVLEPQPPDQRPAARRRPPARRPARARRAARCPRRSARAAGGRTGTRSRCGGGGSPRAGARSRPSRARPRRRRRPPPAGRARRARAAASTSPSPSGRAPRRSRPPPRSDPRRRARAARPGPRRTCAPARVPRRRPSPQGTYVA